MGDLVFATAREMTLHPLVLIEDMGPTTLDEKVDYHPLKERGINTVLELKVLRVGLWGEKGINPPLGFFMTVNARYIRVEDGKDLYDHTFRFEGVSRKFADWAENSGEPFRKELERCYQTLATEIVEKLSLPSEETETQKEVHGYQNGLETYDLNF